jgi:crossover junction endodeoxyribonuclease RuvC
MTRLLRVVALDLSLASTGIAVTHDQAGIWRPASRTVSPRRRDRRPNIIDHERLHETFEAVAAALQCRPDLVVIEWLPLVKGTGDTALRIAELHGAIKHYLFAKKFRYVDVRPQELKTYATGNANAKKDAVIQAVMSRYNRVLTVSGSDQADATALMALALDGLGQPLRDRDNREISVPPECRVAVGKVQWPDVDLSEVAG